MRQFFTRFPSRFLHFWQHLTPATWKQVIRCAGTRRLPGLAAEVAYNSMLALFPALLMLFTTIDLINFSPSTLEMMGEQLSRVAPEEVAVLIRDFLLLLKNTGSRQLLSLSFVASLWAASGAMSAAMNALDQIFQIPPAQTRPFWRAKLVSLCLTIGTVQLLIMAAIVVFISDTLVRIAIAYSGILAPGLLTAWRVFSLPLALGIVAIAAAFLYRFGPSRWIAGTPILPGAILAALFWAISSDLFRFYLSRFGNYNRVYGAVGTFIVLLLWLQLSSLMLLIGAQLNVTVGESIRRRSALSAVSSREAS
jgi:membrane protein